MTVRPMQAVVLAAMLLGVPACGDGDGPPATASRSAASTPSQVVVDYSPTLSDVTALLYLTQRADVEVVAVTLSGTGESHCDTGVPNTIQLLELAGKSGIPVACGPEQALGPGGEWPEAWREAADDLDGLELSPSIADVRSDAVELLTRTATRAAEPIVVVALGPLTNLASAVESDPSFADRVAMVYSMGGAIDVEGNAPEGQAEWNYFVDPTAVDIVISSGLPFTMVPLDATNRVPMTREWFEAIRRHHQTPAAEAVFSMQEAAQPFDVGFFFWDELTAALASDESIATIENRTVTIETDGRAAGMTRLDPEGRDIRVVIDVDRLRFETDLLDQLNGGAPLPEPGVRAAEPAPEHVAYFGMLESATRTFEQGIEPLFETDAAVNVGALLVEGDPPQLDIDQEAAVRSWLGDFWSGATALLQELHDSVADLDVPSDMQVDHERYVGAIDSLIATRDEQLTSIDALSGEALLAFLWTPTPETEAYDDACERLEGAGSVHGIVVGLCSD